MIPHSDVSLIVGPDAAISVADGAKLKPVSEGHGTYSGLIHNKGCDHVAVINLGSLSSGIKGESRQHRRQHFQMTNPSLHEGMLGTDETFLDARLNVFRSGKSRD